ncbi:hypothetical protein ACFQ1S_44320, partial [Kibdelosporangium lantanae]
MARLTNVDTLDSSSAAAWYAPSNAARAPAISPPWSSCTPSLFNSFHRVTAGPPSVRCTSTSPIRPGIART